MTNDEERALIAADFHDGPLQSFAALRMRLHVLHQLLLRDPSSALREVEEIESLCEARLVEMRQFLAVLRGEDTTPTSLAALLERFRRESGLRVEAQFDENTPPCLLPLISEALHNAHKHAQATAVLVNVRREGPHWVALIEDNGKGIPQDAELRTLNERLRAYEGSLSVSGTRVEMRVPA